ncbi:MAG: hypothetical protein O2809_01355 [Proteobacteria bacterium]|nr:hypothetical protein [Pseudomonadota bacterium]
MKHKISLLHFGAYIAIITGSSPVCATTVINSNGLASAKWNPIC